MQGGQTAGTPPDGAGGAAASAKAMEAEHHIALVRALVILFNSVVYGAFLAPGGIPWLAWTIIAVANLYALYVISARPYRRFPAMTTATFTAVTDGVLITAWLVATGGADSPFFLLWYLSLIAVAFRYDGRTTMAAGILYALAHLTVAWATGPPTDLVELGVRTGYILLCGMLGSLLAQASSQAVAARVRLESDLGRSQRFRILAEATSEGIFVHRQGLLLQVNRALADLLGRPVQQIVGHDITEFVHEDDIPLVRARVGQPADTPVELRLVRPDGTTVPVVARGTAIPSDGQALRVVAVRDIRAELEAEAQRSRAREREAELAQLRQLDRLRTTFINTAAHELNTPLTPIRLQLFMLQQRERDPDNLRVLAMLDRNLQRLTRLVRDMLDVSRLEEGRFRLRMEPTDLSDVVRQAVETFAYQAKDQTIALSSHVEDGLTVEGDRERLEQVLANLLSNALRFSPKGGNVQVAARRFGPVARIVVQDDGLGMSAAQRDGLFQPFSQQHVALNAGGLGLGLFITQGIVLGHGGSIRVDSDGPGRGTTATVEIPLGPDVAQPL